MERIRRRDGPLRVQARSVQETMTKRARSARSISKGVT